MSINITVEVWCDECKHSEFVEASSVLTPFLQKDDLKFEPYVEYLEEDGWVVNNESVLCPGCKEK